MGRSLNNKAAMRHLLLPSLLLLAGCAFDEGRPWGAVDVTVTATAPATLRTAEGIAIQLDTVELTLDTVALSLGDISDAPAFDPSAPPADCTLCHAGHCHCGDKLIPYAELQNRGTLDDAPIVTLTARLDPIALTPTPATLPIERCGIDIPPCEIPRGTLRRAALTLRALHLAGTANRAAFDLDLPLALELTTPLDIPFDRDHPFGARIALTLRLPAELFDGIDWTDLTETTVEAITQAITENTATHATLSVDVTRVD